MPQASAARAKCLRDVAERLHTGAFDLQTLAEQLAQPSRSIAHTDRLIEEGERLATELNDCAGVTRRLFRD